MAQAQWVRHIHAGQQRGISLKVLHVVAPSPVGGAERVVEALAVGHRQRGHDVSVATMIFSDGVHPLVAALANAGVPVHQIRLSPRDYLGERRELRSLLTGLQPEIMHTHGYRTDVVDRSVAAQLRIPTVTTVHGPSMNGGLKGAFYEWVQRTNYRKFDAVVAVSAALHATTMADGVAAGRLHLIPNALGGIRKPLARAEARQRLGITHDATVIGWVGRLIPVKGADIFMAALQHLPPPRPLVAMIGHGSEADNLARQAGELDLQHTVRFYRDITDADRLFSAFDAFVLSSRSEGTPLVLLEAMAARVPIIAARVGGVPEVISQEEALLVPSEDPTALAAAMRKVLENPPEARRRAEQAAVRLAADYSFDRWLGRYEAVYQSVLSRKPRAAQRDLSAARSLQPY